MGSRFINTAVLLFLIPVLSIGQSGFPETGEDTGKKILYGFVRGGFYSDFNDAGKLVIPSAFSDFALMLDAGGGNRFSGNADLRFRYGTEFSKPVSTFDLREAYVSVKGTVWDINIGQKIIKWGRADFTNPTQKLSPQNLVIRSMDREDMDMGNLLLSGRWFPASFISLEAVAIPFHRSSVLLTEPLELPVWVNIEQSGKLLTDPGMFSYALKADFRIRGFDFSISWFDGYDPMPGIRLDNFRIDTVGMYPVPSAGLKMQPYDIKNIGFDFETAVGSFGIRGEASWMMPSLSHADYEYVPFSELKYAIGADWMKGDWRITGEYSGKTIPNHEPSQVEPVIGTDPDPAAMAQLLATPGFDFEDYVRQQVAAFNMLYNYQIEKSYHSVALRVERDFMFGNFTPSLTVLYNFTSRDFMVMPEILWKPADGLTISIAGEYFKGPDGSVYDIADDFMNCFRAGLKVNF
jgi:hypothetical protein